MADILIAVMGPTGSGKSTFINLVSGSRLQVGEGLLSCTPEVQTSQPFQFQGRQVTLIDTPGFDDTFKSDTQILKLVAAFLANAYRENKKLSGVIYMHRISDFRMGGVSRRNFGMFRSLCGESTLRNVVIGTNMWSEVDEQAGAAREQQLATDDLLFKPVLDKGAHLMRHLNTIESGHAILQQLVNNHPLPLQIQYELVDEHKRLEDTKASEELLTQEMQEAKLRQEEEERKQREAKEAALRAMEEQKQREIAEAQRQKAEAEARAREEQERLRRQQEEQRQREVERLAEVQRVLEQQEAARRAEEERVRLLREDQARQEREAAEARRRHEEEMERIRRNQKDDCRIF